MQTAVLKLIGGSYASVATQLNGSLESEARTAELKRKLIALENEVDGADKVRSVSRVIMGCNQRVDVGKHLCRNDPKVSDPFRALLLGTCSPSRSSRPL